MNNRQVLKRLYKNYIRKYLKNFSFALILSLLVASSTACIAWLLDPAIKKLFIEKNMDLIYLIPLTIVFAFSIKGLSLYFARTTIIKVGAEIEKELRKDMTSSMINADTQVLDRKHSGKFISHMLFDVSLIVGLTSSAVLILIKDTLTLIGLVGLMFYQNWKLALFAVIMIPLASFAAKSLGKRIAKVTTEAQEKSGALTTYIAEMLKNSKIIKIYQKENFEKGRADKFISELKEKGQKIAIVLVRATPIMEFLTGVMIAGLIYYSTILIGKGSLEINNFFSFLAAMMLSYQPVRSLATVNISVNQGISAAKRVFGVIDEE